MTTHTPSIFSIATGSPEPIYRQLIEQTRRQVASGHLAPGDAMPSVRDIAQALALNPMTVSKAYGMLEAEGLLARRRGQGMLVAELRPVVHSEEARIELLRPTLERVAQEARQLELQPATVIQLLEQLLKEKP
jgi:GntR family transcriptional regulator